MTLEAETCLSVVKLAAKETSAELGFGKQVTYWKHVISAIRWLAYRASGKQRHLLEMSDDDFMEVLRQWDSD